MWKWVKKVVAVVTGVVLALGFAHAAYGTNEGSYQWGYKPGRGYECSNYDADCDNGLGACDIGAKLSYSMVTAPGVPTSRG